MEDSIFSFIFLSPFSANHSKFQCQACTTASPWQAGKSTADGLLLGLLANNFKVILKKKTKSKKITIFFISLMSLLEFQLISYAPNVAICTAK
jgi:hypothetical protein